MLLENKFYRVVSVEKRENLSAVYSIDILPECEVYKGHFPGNPVCPGVFNIETIKECSMLLCGKQLRIAGVKQCRFTAISTPEKTPRAQVELLLTPSETGYAVTASIYDSQLRYVEFKGNLIYD